MKERVPQFELDEMERRACEGDSPIHGDLGKLISALRSAYHELDDPNYLYVGRIHRQGIVSRNAEIDRLREELRAARDPLAKAAE